MVFLMAQRYPEPRNPAEKRGGIISLEDLDTCKIITYENPVYTEHNQQLNKTTK